MDHVRDEFLEPVVHERRAGDPDQDRSRGEAPKRKSHEGRGFVRVHFGIPCRAEKRQENKAEHIEGGHERREEKDAEDQEMAGVVRSELRRIDSLVTQMLRFAAPRPTAPANVNVHHLLDHSLRLLEHQMSERMIALKREYLAIPDTVRADDSQLQQVFMNLLLNGFEAIGSNGELSIITKNVLETDGSRWLKIHICDTGVGIVPENLARVFDTFFTTKKNGTGLGLAICRRVVQEHSGRIEVQSNAGRGSAFTICLPAE